MGAESVKNDIKTLFLIINSINGLAAGLFPVSLGIGMAVAVVNAVPAVDTVSVGLPMILLAALGCCGAIHEDKTMLYVYSAVTGLLAAVEAAVAVLHVLSAAPNSHLLQIIILHISTTLAALASAVFLAKQAPGPQGQGSSGSTQRTFIWRCFSFALAFIVALVIFMKYMF